MGLTVPYGACHGVTCSVRCHLVRWQRLPPEQVAAAATWETARSRPGELGRAPARLEVDGPSPGRMAPGAMRWPTPSRRMAPGAMRWPASTLGPRQQRKSIENQ